MLGSIKALIVVLAIAAIVFRLAKPIALQFMSSENFARRRLVWLILTAVSFVSPNLWIYVLIAVPMLVWLYRKDSNPIALYLFMFHVVPPTGVAIPILGNNGLFDLDNYRLLAFCVLLPAVIRYRMKPKMMLQGAFGAADILLLAFGVLQVALYTPPDLPLHFVIPDSPANALRRAILFLLDTYLLYYAITRVCSSRQEMVESLSSFCLGCAVMAAVAMFERLRGWLLYVDISSRWGSNPNAGFYLMRGGSVRAQVSAGHSISLGFLLAIAFGFWLYLKSRVRSKAQRTGVILLLWGGLIGAYSRGGWLGGAVIYFAFIGAGQRAASRLVKGAVMAVLLAAAIALSPMGSQIEEMLPQAGKPADLYRHQLAERGWSLVFAHPAFGNQFPWPELEDLRQGEGIIDIVNTYLGVGLNYGFVGLFCFLSFILMAMLRIYPWTRKLGRSDPDFALLGTSLIACIIGILVMIDSSSFMFGIEKMFYVLAAFAVVYVRLVSFPPTLSATANTGNAL